MAAVTGVRRLGIEHEFVVSIAGRGVDFRDLIHGLRLGQPNLDPADPNAYRLSSGAAITADGAEAEIALPPITIRPGFTDEARQRARLERHALAARLPIGHAIEGCSTHISVSVDDELANAVCDLYARTFAPALMLLMDRRESPGLLVRPRPGRLELGGEFLDGECLAAASVFAVGSVLACERALRNDDTSSLPPSLEVTLEPARARFGWYVDRTAFGSDLYSTGRAASISTASGDQLTGQRVLELGWHAARAALGQLASRDELSAVDGRVSGERPLPCESAQLVEDPPPLPVRIDASPYGSAILTRERRVAAIAPVMLTWDLCVFLLLDPARGRTAFAAVPGTQLGAFLRELDEGRLNDALAAFLRERPTGSRPSSPADVSRVTLFDELGPRLALVAAERGPDGTPLPATRSAPQWAA